MERGKNFRAARRCTGSLAKTNGMGTTDIRGGPPEKAICFIRHDYREPLAE